MWMPHSINATTDTPFVNEFQLTENAGFNKICDKIPNYKGK